MTTTALDKITFDEFSKIRVLPSHHYDASEKLKDGTHEFISKMNEFSSHINYFNDMVGEKAKQVELEKLKVWAGV
ncbi:hypothetical protein HDU91_005926 [Kappamyces sp. JEL0680]|nr:hypothetical protein HDU91_005926 [Kappamyces sp. JEL0680]